MGSLEASDFYRWHWPDGSLLTFSLNGRLHSQTESPRKTRRLFSLSQAALADSANWR